MRSFPVRIAFATTAALAVALATPAADWPQWGRAGRPESGREAI